MVVDAGAADGPEAAAALSRLCCKYREPLLVYLRRHGYDAANAEDMLQHFFEAKVLSRLVLANVSPEVGRFRAWLQRCLRNAVINEQKRLNTVSRGGRYTLVPLEGDNVSALEDDNLTPEQAYDRAWAATLVRGVLADLEREYREAGRQALFEVIRQFMPGAASELDAADAAARLGIAANHVRSEVSKLRTACGDRILAEVRNTVRDPRQARDEAQYLLSLLAAR